MNTWFIGCFSQKIKLSLSQKRLFVSWICWCCNYAFFCRECCIYMLFCRECPDYALFDVEFYAEFLEEILRNTQNFGRNSAEKTGHWSLCPELLQPLQLVKTFCGFHRWCLPRRWLKLMMEKWKTASRPINWTNQSLWFFANPLHFPIDPPPTRPPPSIALAWWLKMVLRTSSKLSATNFSKSFTCSMISISKWSPADKVTLRKCSL